MAYLNKDREKDAPWFAGGFLATGIFLIGIPACLPTNNDLTKLARTSCSFLSVGFSVSGVLLYRRTRYVLYPEWLRNKRFDFCLQEDLAEQQSRILLAKESAVLVAQAKIELEQQFPNNNQAVMEPANDSPSAKPPQTTNDCLREAERLLSELTTDQQKQILKNLEKSLEVLPDNAYDDSTPTSTPTSNSQEALAENGSGSEAGSDGSEVPDGHLEAIHELIKAGMTKTKAIALISGAKSGRKFSKYSQAYKAKYGEIH